MEHDIAILNLADRGLTDDRLGALFAKAPLNSIILLEYLKNFISFYDKNPNFKLKFI
jgi:hypothetical protein